MSKLDASPHRSGRQPSVNPEMKLRAMIEIAQKLGRAVTLDEVLPKLLDSMFKIFTQADRGFIILRTMPDGPLIPKAIKCRHAELEDRVRISRTIVNQAMESKQATLSADAASDVRFEASQSIADLRIRSLMCAPLINGEGHALGVIQVDTTDQRQRFQKDDLDVLASIAAQAGDCGRQRPNARNGIEAAIARPRFGTGAQGAARPAPGGAPAAGATIIFLTFTNRPARSAAIITTTSNCPTIDWRSY